MEHGEQYLNKIENKKLACITLDLEQDHGGILEKPVFEAFSAIPYLMDIIDNYHVPLTCFVQGSLFESHPEVIEDFSDIKTEFQLHAYSHSISNINHELEIKNGKNAYIDFFNKDPVGYRSQAGVFNQSLVNSLSSYGFKYDSSLVPSYRPGLHSNLQDPVFPYKLFNSDIIEFPGAVLSKFIRIPISLSFLKLLGRPYIEILKKIHLPNLLIFSFHLHDLKLLNSSKDISAENMGKFSLIYKLIFGRIYGNDNGLEILNQFVFLLLKKGYKLVNLRKLYGCFK